MGGRDFETRLQPELGVAGGREGRRRKRNFEFFKMERFSSSSRSAIDHRIEFRQNIRRLSPPGRRVESERDDVAGWGITFRIDWTLSHALGVPWSTTRSKLRNSWTRIRSRLRPDREVESGRKRHRRTGK